MIMTPLNGSWVRRNPFSVGFGDFSVYVVDDDGFHASHAVAHGAVPQVPIPRDPRTSWEGPAVVEAYVMELARAIAEHYTRFVFVSDYDGHQFLTLSQDFAPFGNRTTGMMKARQGPGACREEGQVH